MNTGQIVKAKIEREFTVIPNSVSQNKLLNLEERGLLVYLLSLPSDWVIYKSNLHILIEEKEGTVDRVFKSLQNKGYILSVKQINKKGRFCGWNHIVYENPTVEIGSRTEPTSVNPDLGETTPIQIHTEYKEVIKNKEKENILSFCEQAVRYLNEKTGSEFRASTKSTKSKIKTLLDNSFTIEDIKLVIDLKTASWLNDSKMSEYLRPETLFGGKFEAYLQEAKRSLPKSKPSLPEQQW